MKKRLRRKKFWKLMEKWLWEYGTSSILSEKIVASCPTLKRFKYFRWRDIIPEAEKYRLHYYSQLWILHDRFFKKQSKTS